MHARNWLLLCLCVLLGACNTAMSEQPLFAETKRSSALRLEDGLWYRVDGDCAVDDTLPKGEWPKCADWVILKDSKSVISSDTKTNEEHESEDVFIVDGRPPVIQGRVKANGSNSVYAYLVLDPATYSPDHKLTAVKVWPVSCGIEQGKPGSGKIRPFPGFTKDCLTTSAAALHAAAAKSRNPSKEAVEWKWVRPDAQ